MKLTLQQIVDSIGPYNELNAMKYSPVVSLKIYKLGKELDRELQTYRDLGRKIYEKFEVPQTPTGYDFEKLTPEKKAEVEKEMKELSASEVEIQDYKIPISALDLPNNFVTPNTIGNLEWLFEIPEELKQGEPKAKRVKK